MIIRIVKMTFDPERVSEFEQLFYEVKPQIEAFSGCNNVTLLQDVNQPNIFFTYSN